MPQRRIPEPVDSSDPGPVNPTVTPVLGGGAYINLKPLGGTLRGTYTNLSYTTLGGAQQRSINSTTATFNLSRDPSKNEVLCLDRIYAGGKFDTTGGNTYSIYVDILGDTDTQYGAVLGLDFDGRQDQVSGATTLWPTPTQATQFETDNATVVSTFSMSMVPNRRTQYPIAAGYTAFDFTGSTVQVRQQIEGAGLNTVTYREHSLQYTVVQFYTT